MSSVNDILDDLEGASHDGKVTLSEMAEALGHRGAAPFLIVPPLIEISPIGGIPAVPTFLAVVVLIFAVQIAAGRDEPHVPGKLGRRGVDGERLRGATAKLRPLAARLDGWFHGRLRPLTGKPARQAAALVVVALCLVVPPLELVPFASTIPMGAILVFGLAFLFRDGLLMLAAFAVSALAAYGLATVVPWGGLSDRIGAWLG
ncbi:MAG: exopolysaccharide biosynthesis protein [Hasllibacter sp.]